MSLDRGHPRCGIAIFGFAASVRTRAKQSEFKPEVRIDVDSFPAVIRVIPDGLMSHGFLIGTDLLDATELTVNRGQITVHRVEPTETPHISRINLEYAINEVDISHVKDTQTRGRNAGKNDR